LIVPEVSVWPGVYRIDGDTLTLIVGTPDKPRPSIFDESNRLETHGEIWGFERKKGDASQKP
jgi:hypothetical protein